MTFYFVKKRSQNNAVSEFSFTTLIILTINQGSDNKIILDTRIYCDQNCLLKCMGLREMKSVEKETLPHFER